MLDNNIVKNYLTSPVRDIDARVELYEGSTLLKSFSSRDKLIEFTVERIGEENKFFGFGIAQKINVKLIDINRELTISPDYSIKVVYAVQGEEVSPYPTFYISETNRDEKTNQLSITGYDLLKASSEKTVGDLTLTAPYTTTTFMSAACAVLGCQYWVIVNLSHTETAFTTSFTDGANFEGHESLREALNDIAEITQSVYYIDPNNRLTFKRLSKTANPKLIINKNAYIELTSGSTHTLSQINKTTELGNNINSTTSGTGNIQYIRDNAFYELLPDSTVGSLLNAGIEKIGGLEITQFDCEWRGNYLLEPGDKLQIEAKNGTYITTFLLDDVIEYKGYLTEKTKWDYNPEEGEHSNPSTLGDILNQTVAKVDKVNKEITLVVKDTEDMREEVNQIKVSTEGIELSVKALEEEVENFAEITINEDAIVSKVEQRVNASVDAKDEAMAETLRSEITQTANSITSTVEGQNGKISSIEQTVNGIKLSTNTANGTASITIGGKTVEVPDGNGIEDMVDNKIEEAVADITITGYVRFEDLKKSGSTDINGDNITTGEIAAEFINLGGLMEIHRTDYSSIVGGYIGYGSGDDGDNASTPGCMMTDKSESNYFIATPSGVRMTYNDDNAVYCIEDYVALQAGSYGCRLDPDNGNFYPTVSGNQLLGTSSNKWQGVYAKNGTIQTSDERAKNTIEYDMTTYEPLFNALKPVHYKFNDGTSDRFHTGFISQDVENAISTAGLTSKDFAGFIKTPIVEEVSGEIIDYDYCLRYDEFVALNTHMIQKLMKRVDELEAEVKTLKGEQ